MGKSFLKEEMANAVFLPEYDELCRKEGHFHRFTYRGYPCMVSRNHSMSWCGYVGLSESHKDYNQKEIVENEYSVHGGITFCNFMQYERAKKFASYYWIGFDCSHYMDASPLESLNRYSTGNQTYRDLKYVKNETKNLVEQAHKRSRKCFIDKILEEGKKIDKKK